MTRFIPLRVAVWVAILCLAVTVVALGAAAKHGQFESVSHDTGYLTQSAKMVTGNQMDCSFVIPPVSLDPLPALHHAAPAVMILPASYVQPVSAPLLV